MYSQNLIELLWQSKALNLGLSRPGYYCSHGAVVTYLKQDGKVNEY